MEEESGFLTFSPCFVPLKEAEEKPEQAVIRAGEAGWELMHKLAAFYIAPFQHIQFCTAPSWKQLGPAPDVLEKKKIKKKKQGRLLACQSLLAGSISREL